MMGLLLSNRKALSEKALGKNFFQQCSIFCRQVEKETKFLNVLLRLAAF